MSEQDLEQEDQVETSDILDVPDDELEAYMNRVQEEEDSNSTNETEEEEEESDEEELQEETNEEDSASNEEEDVTDDKEVSEDVVEDSENASEETSEETDTTDYHEEYKRLLAPFKANGKEIAVDSVDDARQLMQMGANYTKKMQALAPNLKLIKLLENNGLLEQDKIGFLIDLSKKNPDAIKKLLKDSNVDPLELDMDEAESYKPNAYTVNDKELELDSVLEEIKESPKFNTTADVIGNKWDEASKKVILENPVLIRIINDHVHEGIYEKISSVVERERMLGRLQGMSDIEAYKTVGDAIHAQGGFGNKQPQGTFKPTESMKANKVDPSIAKRKKAASSTKSKPATSKKEDFNPLSMSDEEFEKIAHSKYI